MSNYLPTLSDHDYKNWVKYGLGLHVSREAIAIYLADFCGGNYDILLSGICHLAMQKQTQHQHLHSFLGFPSILNNNIAVDTEVTDKMPDKNNVFCKIRDNRNSILHKADMKLTDTELAGHNATQYMLGDTKCLAGDQNAIRSRQVQESDTTNVRAGVEKVIEFSCSHMPSANDIIQPNYESWMNRIRKVYETGKDQIVAIQSIARNFLRDSNNTTIPIFDIATVSSGIKAAPSVFDVATVSTVFENVQNAFQITKSDTTETLYKIGKISLPKSDIKRFCESINNCASILSTKSLALNPNYFCVNALNKIEQLTFRKQDFCSKFRTRVSTFPMNFQWDSFHIFQNRNLPNYAEYLFSQYMKYIILLNQTVIDDHQSCKNQDSSKVCIIRSHSFHEHLYNENERYSDNRIVCSCHESLRTIETESQKEKKSYTLYENGSNRSICCQYSVTQMKTQPRSQGTNTPYTETESVSSNKSSRDMYMETMHEIRNHELLLNKNEHDSDSHNVSAVQSSLSNEDSDTVLLKAFQLEPSLHSLTSSRVIDNEFGDVRLGKDITTAEQTTASCQTKYENIIAGTDTESSGHLYSLKSFDARTELISLVLPSKLTEAYSYARKPSKIRLQNEVPSVGAEYNDLDLKQKVRRKQRNYPKLVEINKAFKYKDKLKHHDELNCRDSYVEYIRDVTWLPLDMLPVPKVEIDVRRIEFEPLNTIIEQLARDENPGPHITMRYELLRFCTLRNYPKRDKPYLIRISGAGFYYAAEGDELVCYCCGMRKSGWTESDQPMEIHKRLSPRCSYLVRNEDVNVPVRVPESGHEVDRFAFLNEPASAQNTDSETTESNSTSLTIERVSSSEVNNETQEDHMTTAGSQELSHPIVNPSSFMSERPQRRPGNFSYSSNTSTPEVNNETPQEDFMSTNGSQEFSRPIVSSSSATPERPQRRHGNFSYSSNNSTAIATTTSQTTSAPARAATRNPQPKHPNYAPRSVRVASFQGWPDDLTQTPEVLADAGFYYAGIADCVRCYFCGLGLRHWSEEDNPWIEHARWSRPCLYVKMIKGEEFINLVHLAVQYTENERGQNEDQHTTVTASGDTNTEHTGSQIPIDEINRLLLTDAAQSVLDMGYQPDMIKKAIEKVLIRDGRAGISSTNIMAMIFEIEEEETEAALTNRVNNIEISSNDNRSANQNAAAASSTVNTFTANATVASNATTNNNNAGQRNRPNNSSLPTNQTTVSARSTENGMTTASNDTGPASSTTTNSLTRQPQSKPNTNRKDAKTVKKENERMKMQTMCQICKNNSVAIVFLPCGHLVTCETCAPTLRNCPMPDCDKIVKGTVKAFMA